MNRTANRLTTQVLGGSLTTLVIYFAMTEQPEAAVTVAMTNIITLAVQVIFSKYNLLQYLGGANEDSTG